MSLPSTKIVLSGDDPGSFNLKCIVCGAELTGDEEVCPECSTPLDSMFTKECPKCGYENQWSVQKCEQCGADISREPPAGSGLKRKPLSTPDRIIYRCPKCGFCADYFFTKCPVCSTQLV